MQATTATRTATDPASVRALPGLGPGQFVGRYRLGEVIGAGGMGVVYEAHDPALSRTVALKLMRAAVGMDGRARARFVGEARALAKVSHPNIVPIHDFGCARDHLYIAMPRIDGLPLDEHVARYTPTLTGRLTLLLAAGRGLAAAHAQGLVHRDVKPSNILVDHAGRVYVCDFGLATQVLPTTRGGSSGDGSRDPDEGSQACAGTLLYMPPEQHAGGRVDAKSDQFAFCATAWQIMGGARPFVGRDARSLEQAKRQGRVQPSGLRGRLRRVLLRGMASDPQARWPDLEALLAALAAKRRSAPLALYGAVGAAALASLVPIFTATDVCPVTAVSWAPHLDPSGPLGLRTSIAQALRRYQARDAADVQAACLAWQSDATAAGNALDCIVAEHRQYDAIVEIAKSDEARLEPAYQIAHGLAHARACEPHRIETRRVAAQIRTDLIDAELLYAAGDIDAAEQAAKRILATAARTGDQSLVARAELFLVRIQDERGVGPQARAERMWSIAAGAALSQDPEFASEALLGTLIWAACEAPEQSAALEVRTREAVERTGPDPVTNAIWHAVQVRVRVCRGDLQGAIDIGKRGRLLTQALGEPKQTALVVRELVMASATKEPRLAVPYLAELVDATMAVYGPDHRRTAEDQLLAAEIGAAAGEGPVADDARAALAVIAGSMLPHSAGWMDAVQRVARIEVAQGDVDLAIDRLTRLLQLDGHPDATALAIATVQRNLAQILFAADREPERAAGLLESATPVLIANYGDPSAPVLQARRSRVLVLARLGRHDEAVGAAAQLCRDTEVLAPASAQHTDCLVLHGETLVGAGRGVEAQVILQDAWRGLRDAPDPSAAGARAAVGMAAAAQQAGDTALVRTWLDRAQRHAAAATPATRQAMQALQTQVSWTSTGHAGSKQ